MGDDTKSERGERSSSRFGAARFTSDAAVFEELAARYPHGMAVYEIEADGIRLVHLNRQAVRNVRMVDPDFEWTAETTFFDLRAAGETGEADSTMIDVQTCIATGDTIEGRVQWAGYHWKSWALPISTTHAAVIFVDCTEDVLALERLDRAHKAAEMFAFVASHDLREPLRAIALTVDEAIEDHPSVRTTPLGLFELLKEIRGNARRSLELVGSLLSFSRAAKNMSPAPVSIGAVFEEALESVRVPSDAIILNRLTDLEVNADRALLARVFANLLSNAFKFHRPDEPPAVEVQATKVGGVVRVCVGDRGVGIDPTVLPKIGQPFFRAHRNFEGTGIGLAHVNRLVEAHGGQLDVTSSGEGLGTLVTFTLPAVLS